MMKKTQKTYRSGVSKMGFIRQALAGYLRDSDKAIVSEMVQNADDAQARWISFDFRPQALIVRNNSIFTEEDFENIAEIARGGKRNEKEKIGTWGTGFVSVYYLTDKPELFSSREYLVIDPTQNHEITSLECSIDKETMFRLPWRRKHTLIGQELGAPVWDDKKIEVLKCSLETVVSPLVMFLRHVRTIEVKEKGTIVYQATKKYLNNIKIQYKNNYEVLNYKYTHIKRESIQITHHQGTDFWLYYRAIIYKPREVSQVTIKDAKIAIALPIEVTDGLMSEDSGLLYNFLPTPIKTGLPFHINGAFFPDNNRRSILTIQNTHPEKAGWNKRVISGIAELFIEVLLDLRDQVSSPQKFYALLPTNEPKEEVVRPIYKRFIEEARYLAIVKSTQDKWCTPQDILISEREKLYRLSHQYLPLLPKEVSSAFRDFLQNKLRPKKLTVNHILSYLEQKLTTGVSLEGTHPMINGRQKLKWLYVELPKQETRYPHSYRSSAVNAGKLAIWLSEDGRLWRAEDVFWLASQKIRRLLSDTNIRFADLRMQKEFTDLFRSRLPEFRGADLVRWLYQNSASEEVKSLLKNQAKLKEVLKFIASDVSNVNRYELAQLPIVYTTDEKRLSGEGVYFCTDIPESTRTTLRKLGFVFVHPEWERNSQIKTVYHKAGVQKLEAQKVINVLKTSSIIQDSSTNEKLNYLRDLYGYFDTKAKEKANLASPLRELPLVLTQKGRLISVSNGSIHLPPSDQQWKQDEISNYIEKLELDQLVHQKLVTENRNFLTKILRLEELSLASFILDFILILPNYHSQKIEDKARQAFLGYIQKQIDDLAEESRNKIYDELRKENFILCDDGQYRKARNVYFASPTLDAIFMNGYPKLHPNYNVPVAKPDSPSEAPYRTHNWYSFLKRIGVNEEASSKDLSRAIRKVVGEGDPTQEKIDRIRPIYELLNNKIGKGSYPESNRFLRTLKRVAWFPAEGNFSRWFKAREIYRPMHKKLIGAQGSVLITSLTSPKPAFYNFFGIPKTPPVEVVIANLRNLAQKKKEVPQQIYKFLGQHASRAELEPLRREKIVWDAKRKCYWNSHHIFLGNYEQQFGSRRGYIQPKGKHSALFFEKIGVCKAPNQQDYVAFVKEIAQEYNNKAIDETDKKFLLSTFAWLAEQGSTPTQLQQVACILGEDGRLYRPTEIVLVDVRKKLEYFKSDSFPTVDRSSYTLQIERLLKRLAVPQLSDIVTSQLITCEGKDDNKQIVGWLCSLIPALQRIDFKLRGLDQYKPNDLRQLAKTEIRTVTSLQVQYHLNNPHLSVTGKIADVEALYRKQKGKRELYIRMVDNQCAIIPLAKELALQFFPDRDDTAPLITSLLQSKNLAEAQKVLNEYDYPELPLEGSQKERSSIQVHSPFSSSEPLNEEDDMADAWSVTKEEPTSFRQRREEEVDSSFSEPSSERKRANAGLVHERSAVESSGRGRTPHFPLEMPSPTFGGTYQDDDTDFLQYVPHEIKENIERISMRLVMEYEQSQGAEVHDVSTPQKAKAAGLQKKWPGFDVLSRRPDGQVRKIEVKGRAQRGHIEMTDNEWHQAKKIGSKYWLYVVYGCNTNNRELICVRDPYKKLPVKKIMITEQEVLRNSD